MAKFNRLLGSFVACAAMLGGISTPASAADINIIPIPVKTQVQKGEFVRIGLSSLRSTSGAETSWLRLMKSRRLLRQSRIMLW